MNNDLISRAEMLNRLNDMFKAADVLPVKAYSNAFRLAIVAAETAPAVDAEPVRIGRWKYLPETINSVGAYSCSACGFLVFDHRANKCNYCPNCGARMDVEVK